MRTLRDLSARTFGWCVLLLCACGLTAYLGVLVVNSIQLQKQAVQTARVAIIARDDAADRSRAKINMLESQVTILLHHSVASQKQRDHQTALIQELRRELARDHRSTHKVLVGQ